MQIKQKIHEHLLQEGICWRSFYFFNRYIYSISLSRVESVAVVLLHQQLPQQPQHGDQQQPPQGDQQQLQGDHRGPPIARTGTIGARSGPDRVTAIDPNTITT